MPERSVQKMKDGLKGKKGIAMKADLRRIELQCAFDTSSHARQNDPGISFEAFSPSIYEGDDGAGIHNLIFIIQQGYLRIECSLLSLYRCTTRLDTTTLVRAHCSLRAYVGSRSRHEKKSV